MACEVLVFGQELLQLARCLGMPYIRVVEGRLSGDVGLGLLAAVAFDTQTLPLDNKVFQRLRLMEVPLVAIVASYDEAECALRSGCSDVLIRPVAAEELGLRIQNALRLSGPRSITVGALAIDPASRRVTRDTVEIRLRPLEFKLLYHLAANAGRVVSYDELLNEVWGYNYDDGSHLAIKAAIKRLRQQIEPEPARPRYILNVVKVGYVLKAEEE
ncbi:MAG TPA: response regulator transcription factor [Anaerolineae bacterium]|nr:response regulator transcription factor [Anaerolineae bacterium]HOR01475.1 response regulator transcription factor [Anaerolineae bacterium]HPL30386.1 response regulator transcription factor [Anaerolineae bacterium]